MSSQTLLLEVEEEALERLLSNKALSLDHVRCLDRNSKQRLRQLTLEVLKTDLRQL